MVLLTWLALRNEPYQRVESGGEYLKKDGQKQSGFLIPFLKDHKNRIHDIVIFHQDTVQASSVYADLEQEFQQKNIDVRLHPHTWNSKDPTDHNAIFDFLQKKLPLLRREFSEKQLLINISAGTRAMHTVWILLAQAGLIKSPFQLIQTSKNKDSRLGQHFTPVNLTLTEFFKGWETSVHALEKKTHSFIWDPSNFRSQRLNQLYTEATRFAQLNVPVLILGERGTGKTTLASWIRFRSPFRKESNDNSWAIVSCGQFGSGDMIRSELFGHTKGAYTGADTAKDGLLDKAHEDSLFLDEIGDISRDLQRMLIKVLEEGYYTPMGSTKRKHSKFRLISATNVPIDTLKMKLDLDFFDRISGFILTVPPLREIPEEIEWLWPTVLEEAARRAGVRSQYGVLNERQNQKFIAEIRKLPLYGNVRDLFKIAWLFLASRNDPHQPMIVSDSMAYALEVFNQQSTSMDSKTSANSILTSYVEQRPLELPISGSVLDIKPEIKALQSWFANEIERIAKLHGGKAEAYTTVGKKTLGNWKKYSH